VDTQRRHAANRRYHGRIQFLSGAAVRTAFTVAVIAAVSGLSLLPAACPAATAAAGSADLVFINGAIYTQDAAQPWAEALAVRGGIYIAVGSNSARGLAGPKTRVTDLHGRMLMSGLIDAHIHAVEGANEDLYACIFRATSTPSQIRSKLLDCHRKAARAEWLYGGSWDSDFFSHYKIASPRKWLDAITGDRPAILKDDSHHNAWVNTAALRRAGITADTADPTGGHFERESGGNQPNGIALEAAAELVGAAMPPRSAQELRRSVLHMQEIAHRFGLIGLKEADSVESTISAYHDVEQTGQLTLYVTNCLSTLAQQKTPTTPLNFAEIERIHAAYPGTLASTDCVKVYLDGVPTPARTAAMLAAYVPDAGGATTRGLLHVDPATLNDDVVELDRRGYTVKMHAAGDWSIREGLDAIEAARKANPQVNHDSRRRHELAHAGFIAANDIGRFAALYAVADLSPVIWYPSPIIDAVTAAVGDDRGHHYWPMRALVQSHASMAAGSDWPSVVPSMDPWGGIEAMVTRSDPYKNGKEKLWPEQAIELADALRIYTMGGASALRRELSTGSIEAGKSADFIVLDRNLFKVPAQQISDTRVLLTYFQGKQVFQRVPKPH
jgi:predicted amidohydrolase YtcJ